MKKRFVASLMCVVLMCTLLTGCLGGQATVTVKSDGSGTFSVKNGMTRDAYGLVLEIELRESGEEMSEAEMENYINESLAEEDADVFELNGVTYYGMSETVEFNDITELNELVGDGNMNFDASTTIPVEFATAFVVKDEVLYMTNLLHGTDADAYIEDELKAIRDESIISEDELKAMMDEICILYDFEMPSALRQVTDKDVIEEISGIDFDYSVGADMSAFTITDNKISIDGTKLNAPIDQNIVYMFACDLPGVADVAYGEIFDEAKPIQFDDVPEDFWAADAINWAAEFGVTVGTGDNKFTPDGTLTRAQLYTMICNFCSLGGILPEGDSEYDYWAEPYIRACIEFDVVFGEYDEINPADWDVPILRDEAVALMILADGHYAEEIFDIHLENIPDFDQIDEQYKDHIEDAYRRGITIGVDDKMTFDPDGQLTRAQGCQLIYRLYCSLL